MPGGNDGAQGDLIAAYVPIADRDEAWQALVAADARFAHVNAPRLVRDDPVHPAVATRHLTEELLGQGLARPRARGRPRGSRYRGAAERLGITNGKYAGAIAALDPDAFHRPRTTTIKMRLSDDEPHPSLSELERRIAKRFAPTTAIIDLVVSPTPAQYEVRARPERQGTTILRFHVERVVGDVRDVLPESYTRHEDRARQIARDAARAAAERLAGRVGGDRPRCVGRAEATRARNVELHEEAVIARRRTLYVTARIARLKSSREPSRFGWLFFSLRSAEGSMGQESNATPGE
jgi:hypothetical protein